MNKIDLIIDALDLATETSDFERINILYKQALAAARELKALAQPEREWVGLHLDDMPETYAGDKSFLNIARWAEAKLKEKNA